MSSMHAVTPGPAALDVLGVDSDSARRDNRPRNVLFFCSVRACDKAPSCQHDPEHTVGVR